MNRGEPAVRFIRAMKEYNLELDLKVKTITLYTESDRYSPFTRQADEAIPIGEEMRDTLMEEKFRLLRPYYILSVLEAHQCDAVWPDGVLFLKIHCCKVRRENCLFRAFVKNVSIGR